MKDKRAAHESFLFDFHITVLEVIEMKSTTTLSENLWELLSIYFFIHVF